MRTGRNVKVIELSDRYLVVDSDTMESVEVDNIGFSYEDDAIKWAEEHGFMLDSDL